MAPISTFRRHRKERRICPLGRFVVGFLMSEDAYCSNLHSICWKIFFDYHFRLHQEVEMLCHKWTTLKAQSDNRNWLAGRAGRLFAAELRNLGNSKSNLTAVNIGGAALSLSFHDTWPPHQCVSDIVMYILNFNFKHFILISNLLWNLFIDGVVLEGLIIQYLVVFDSM